MQMAILILALVLAGLFLSRLLFPFTSDTSTRTGRERRTDFMEGNPFHAVSILPADEHCEAVGYLKVQRFLSEEAPGLPLEGCGSSDCQCRYVHYADRRGGARDRRLGPAEDAAALEFWRRRDRRGSTGRRQDDLQPA
jgi:hypothetical protein